MCGIRTHARYTIRQVCEGVVTCLLVPVSSALCSSMHNGYTQGIDTSMYIYVVLYVLTGEWPSLSVQWYIFVGMDALSVTVLLIPRPPAWLCRWTQLSSRYQKWVSVIPVREVFARQMVSLECVAAATHVVILIIITIISGRLSAKQLL